MRIACVLLPLVLLAACTSETAPPAANPAPGAAAVAARPAPLDGAARKRIESRVEAQLRALEPEFWARRSTEGESAANAWLTKQAMAIKERETAIERKNLAAT